MRKNYLKCIALLTGICTTLPLLASNSNSRFVHASKSLDEIVSISLDIQTLDNHGRWASRDSNGSEVRSFPVGVQARFCIATDHSGYFTLWNRYSSENRPSLLLPSENMPKELNEVLSFDKKSLFITAGENLCVQGFTISEMHQGEHYVWIQFTTPGGNLLSSDDYADFSVLSRSASRFHLTSSSDGNMSQSSESIKISPDGIAEWRYSVSENKE